MHKQNYLFFFTFLYELFKKSMSLKKIVYYFFRVSLVFVHFFLNLVFCDPKDEEVHIKKILKYPFKIEIYEN